MYRELIERVVRTPKATRIVLGPKGYMELMRETTYLYRRVEPDGHFHFMGLPVLLEAPREFCKFCGAESEPNVCSYCRQPSETISVESC